MTSPAALAHPTRHLARIVFFVFLLTFAASRVLVILIMTRRMPDLFMHVGQTHVHHLNYGIFLLSTVGAVLLFADCPPALKSWLAAAYAFGMALTFDEFAMWLHLGGSYWQRGSYDAVVILLGLFGLLAFAPRWQRLSGRHYAAAAAMLVALGILGWLSFAAINGADRRFFPRLQELENQGPL